VPAITGSSFVYSNMVVLDWRKYRNQAKPCHAVAGDSGGPIFNSKTKYVAGMVEGRVMDNNCPGQMGDRTFFQTTESALQGQASTRSPGVYTNPAVYTR